MQRIHLTIFGLDFKMGGLMKINLVPINGLPSENPQGLVDHFLSVVHNETYSDPKQAGQCKTSKTMSQIKFNSPGSNLKFGF